MSIAEPVETAADRIEDFFDTLDARSPRDWVPGHNRVESLLHSTKDDFAVTWWHSAHAGNIASVTHMVRFELSGAERAYPQHAYLHDAGKLASNQLVPVDLKIVDRDGWTYVFITRQRGDWVSLLAVGRFPI